MGKPRTRIREFREQGEDHIADWIERKEKARREGVTLWKWLKDNPKPKTTSELQIEENNKDNPLKGSMKNFEIQLGHLDFVKYFNTNNI